MLFSIPFSDRLLIDFRSLRTLKILMLIFHYRDAHFNEIAVSRKLSKNHQLFIQRASKVPYQKSYQMLYQQIHRCLIDFRSNNYSQNGANKREHGMLNLSSISGKYDFEMFESGNDHWEIIK